jgi:hypothetical protein
MIYKIVAVNLTKDRLFLNCRFANTTRGPHRMDRFRLMDKGTLPLLGREEDLLQKAHMTNRFF